MDKTNEMKLTCKKTQCLGNVILPFYAKANVRVSHCPHVVTPFVKHYPPNSTRELNVHDCGQSGDACHQNSRKFIRSFKAYLSSVLVTSPYFPQSQTFNWRVLFGG